MPSAFMRSPADAMAKSGRDVPRNKGGGLLQEDVDLQSVKPGRRTELPPEAANSSAQPDAVRPMSAGEVQSAVQKMVWDAIEYVDQELSPERAVMAKYYQGAAFGNEVEGRSQVVMTELRDTVLMMMPSLMRIFFGAERAVEYAPRRPDQVAQAEQATDFVGEIVVRQDNPGFIVFQNWFNDALVKRLGVTKFWYDDTPETRTYEATFRPIEELALLKMDPQIRILDIVPSPGTTGAMQLYDVTYTQTKQEGRLRFTCMPPEEFLFTRGARTTASDHRQPGVALYVGHRTELTRSQLLEMGVAAEDIEQWAFKDTSLDMNQEEIARQNIVKPDTSAIGPIATQKALYIEGYPWLDADGDGVAELRKVVMLGPSYHVIENVPVDRRPFAILTPDPQPHTVIGQGAYDWTGDLQKINSMVLRYTLDSLALALNNRIAYTEGEVYPDEVTNQEVGAKIRVRNGNQPANVLMEFKHEFVGAASLPVLDFLNTIKERRVGKGPMNVDADIMQSTTKQAVMAAVSAAQDRIELIARTFAETGVKDLFQGILEELVAHQAPPRLVKLRGQYVPMDPRSWDADLDVRVNVALGAGLDDEKYRVLADVAAKQEQIVTMLGPQNPIVSLKQLRDTWVKMLKLRGRQDAESFFNDPPPDYQPPQPSPDAQQAPLMVAQAEQLKAQAVAKKHQDDANLAAKKHEDLMALKHEQLGLKAKEMALTDAREREKLAAEVDLRSKEIETSHHTKVATEELKQAAETARQAALKDATKGWGEAPKHKDIELRHSPDGQLSHLHITEGE